MNASQLTGNILSLVCWNALTFGSKYSIYCLSLLYGPWVAVHLFDLVDKCTIRLVLHSHLFPTWFPIHLLLLLSSRVMYSSTAVSSAAPSVCSQSPYAQFLPLRNFAPAETFCSIYLAQSTVPSTSGCPDGNTLCSVLSSLSKCDRAFISTVWYVNVAFSVDMRLTPFIVIALNRDQR